MTKNNPKIYFCPGEMTNNSNNVARCQILFSNMVLDEKSLATPGFDFINVLCTTFMLPESKSAK